MTPEQLKYSILKYAYSGKLVDVDITNLLPNVRTVSFEEPPFDVPDTWIWTTLGNCCEMYTGNSISENVKKEKYTGISDGLDYIATKDVTFNNSIVYDNGVRIPMGEDFRIAKAGSILMCIEGGSAGRKIGIIDKDVCFGNKLCMFNSEVIYNKYIYFYLQSNEFKKFFSGNMSGIIGGVSIKKLKELPIPIPPLEEQHRIVAKIEELLPFVDRYAEAYEKLEKFNAKFPEDMKKSILQYAIQGKLVEQREEEGTAEELYQQIQEEKQKLIAEKKIKKEKPLAEITEDEIPFDIPESWKWVKMGKVFNIHSSKRVHAKDYTKTGVPFYRSMEVVSLAKGLEPTIQYYIPEEQYQCFVEDGYIMPSKDDLLITCIGGSIGWSWIVDESKFYYKDGNVVAFDKNNFIYTKFLYYWLNSFSFINQVKIDVGGTAYNALTIDMLKNYLIPLPPLEEQKRIVAKIEELLPFCDQLIK